MELTVLHARKTTSSPSNFPLLVLVHRAKNKNKQRGENSRAKSGARLPPDFARPFFCSTNFKIKGTAHSLDYKSCDSQASMKNSDILQGEEREEKTQYHYLLALRQIGRIIGRYFN